MDRAPDPIDADARLHVAVVGMAGRFPEARSVDELWRNIREGRDCVRRFSAEDLAARGVPRQAATDPSFVPAAPVLPDDTGLFDAEFFGFSPREAELLDPQHRIFLESAWEALESAGYNPRRCPPAVGVYAATSISAYLLFNILTRPDLVQGAEAAQAMFCNDKDFLSTRVSYELNLHGPSVTVQTACSSSLVAIHMACQALLTHECDMALAGGVSVHVPQRTGYYFVEGGYNSPDGRCRPFDARAQGTLFGSGAGVVVLKRLADALDAGDTILGVVVGTGISNDGSAKVGFTAPSVAGQFDAVARAYAMADVAPDSIGFIETHGTATALGDAVEIAALQQAFAGVTGRRRCALGSVKANIGHLDAAAGVTGFIKAVLAVRDGVIPPMAHFERPNPALGLDDGPFFVPAGLTPWPEPLHPRRAGVSSFGIGGTNCHVVVEEPPSPRHAAETDSDEIVALSARTPAALDAATARLADHLEREPSIALGDASYTLLVGREHFRHRRYAVCRGREHAIAALRDPDVPATCHAAAAERPATFLFPGGGAQYPTMGADTYRTEAVFRDEFDRCAELLHPILGLDLRRVVHPDASDPTAARGLLNRASYALPALLSVEYALARLWMSWGVSPRAMLGHSLGEYAAAALAGVMSLPDALDLVALRGALIDDLPLGAMVSVALSADELTPLLGDTEIAAINAPAQCVVSGAAPAVDRVVQRLVERGIEHRRIVLQAAGHSALVEPVLERFGERVSAIELRAPGIPYVSCITGQWILAEQARDPGYWVDHFRQTIRFSQAIACIAGERPQTCIEVGPGRTLCSLVRANCPATAANGDLAAVPTWPQARDPQHDRPVLLAAAAKVWALGAPVDWTRVFGAASRRRVALPTYPFERRRYWIEPEAAAVAPRPTAAKTADVGDWLHTATWREVERGESRDAAAIQTCVVFADEVGLAAAAADALAGRGVRVVTVRVATRGNPEIGPHVVRPWAADDFRRLAASLRAEDACPDAVINLSTCGIDTLDLVQERGIELAVRMATAFDAEWPGRPLLVQLASDRMFDVTGSEAALAEKAILDAPCLVIPQEYSGQRYQCVDVGELTDRRIAAIADGLVQELAAGLVDRKIALRSRHRWVEQFERLAPVRQDELLRAGGAYAIVGGSGKVGARIAEYIAMRTGGRLAIVARSGVPQEILRRLQATGAEVTAFEADVEDEQRMLSVAGEMVQRFGRLDGIVHAAGDSGAGALQLIAQLDAARCAAHVRRHADGVRSIAAVVEHVRPDFCMLVSSNATWLGGIGSLAYAAGHQFADAFAANSARDDATRWLSVDWDGWPAADGSLAVADVRTSLDQYVMTPGECVRALDRVLSRHAPARAIVSTGDVAARRREWVTFDAPRASVAQPAPSGPSSSGRPPAPPRTAHERAMVAVWEDVLGVSPIGVNDNFFDLGGNSLMALKVVSRLTRERGQPVSLTSIFEAPTPRTLALLSDSTERAAGVEASRQRGERRRKRKTPA